MLRTSFKVYQFVFLTLFLCGYAYDFSNLENLGERISQRVHAQLAPLQDLGPRITADVNRQLEPLRSGILYRNINPYYPQYYGTYPPYTVNYPTSFPGGYYNFPDLSHLGEDIQQSVYQGLEPVRALEIVMKMKNGVGGITIATHLPEGKGFVIVNHRIYECLGTVSEVDGKCSKPLTPFKIKDTKDHCYNKQSFSIINDHICIGASSVSVVNNNIKCLTSTGEPALLTTLQEFRKLCENISDTVEYRYIANPADPAHVQIPNENKHVKCTNNQPGVCVFTESNTIPNSSNNIVINSYNSGSNRITIN